MAGGLPNVVTVSMSWGIYTTNAPFYGDAENANETTYDASFTTPAGHTGVTWIGASGDNGAAQFGYPDASPNVLAVGGTTLNLNSDGSYGFETGWSYNTPNPPPAGNAPPGSGGGTSIYEKEPAYQQSVQTSGQRTVPDVAFLADGETGVAVYTHVTNSAGNVVGKWQVVGGTSLGAPAWAAMIALVDQDRLAANPSAGTLDGSKQTLPAIYSLPASDFHDVTVGYTGLDTNGNSVYGKPGYDLITGLGSPLANLIVPALAGTTLKANALAGASSGSDGSPSVIGDSGGSETVTARDGVSGTSSITVAPANSSGLGALDWITNAGGSGAAAMTLRPAITSKPAAPAPATTSIVTQTASAGSPSRHVRMRLASIDHVLEHDLLAALDWAKDDKTSHYHGSTSTVSVRVHESGSSGGFLSAIQYGKFTGRKIRST